MLFMKRLLLILILTFSFQTLTKADDIRDFEIEGVSIGDSLLDYFSKDQIENNNLKANYKNKSIEGLLFQNIDLLSTMMLCNLHTRLKIWK